MADPTRLTRRAMKKVGWSQAELARQLEVDTSLVSRLLSGQRKPTRQQAFRLEQLLKVPMSSWGA
jgi:ribosome-binding protein aMBF1 (putative translation factor)